MTTKQIERQFARIKDLHTKTEGLLKDVFSSFKSVAKAPKAKIVVKTKARKAGKPRAGRDGGLNRSELIRSYFEKHGLDTRPRDVIEALKKEGIEVAPALVSIVKHKLNNGTPKAKKEKAPVAKSKTTRRSGDPLPAVVQAVLEKNKDGLKLGDLADKVEAAGYQYSGKKGHEGLRQNVYQALHSLSKEKHHPGYEGTSPVVLHDETSKRYILNPKAKRTA